MDKIAVEEHFVIPDFLEYLANAMPRVTKDEYDRVVAMLSDFGEQRLSAMDGAGVKLAVLSMTGSGVQIERDTQLAIKRARQANDALAAETARRPDRYAGSASCHAGRQGGGCRASAVRARAQFQGRHGQPPNQWHFISTIRATSRFGKPYRT
jgi:predicted TIM-barrel fold metal-dependent hydrolase